MFASILNGQVNKTNKNTKNTKSKWKWKTTQVSKQNFYKSHLYSLIFSVRVLQRRAENQINVVSFSWVWQPESFYFHFGTKVAQSDDFP